MVSKILNGITKNNVSLHNESYVITILNKKYMLSPDGTKLSVLNGSDSIILNNVSKNDVTTIFNKCNSVYGTH